MAKKSGLRLVYLVPNAAFVFIYGDSPLRMDGESLFYQTRAEAVAAARRHGLAVEKDGRVHASGENPFGGDSFNRATRMGNEPARQRERAAHHERGENPVTPRRAGVIERSHQAFEKAREAHDPKKFKRGGGYTPEEYKAIAHAAGLKKGPSNRALGKLELHRFKTERPENIFAYYKGNARIGEPITNWMGDVLGRVITRGVEHRARGVKLVSIHMKAITGDLYAGKCNLETGNYCKMKKMISSSKPSAAKHERGENPKVSHDLKARMNKVLGKRG